MRDKLRFFFYKVLPLLFALVFQVGLYVLFFYYFEQLAFYFSIGSMAISLFVVAFILSKDEQPLFKLSWIILILLVPIFGGVLYILVTMHRLYYTKTQKYQKSIEYRHALLEETKVKIPANHVRTFTYLGSDGWTAYQNTKGTFIESGQEKLVLLLEQLQKAKDFIFIEYFIITEGEMWEEILAILKQKVSEGVTVKLIYDDLGSAGKLPLGYHKYLKKLGIDVVRFNKVNHRINFANNYRNHRKIVVIDNKVAFTGGINIGDEYTNKVKRFGYWLDSAIMLEGEAVRNFTVMFLENYAFETKTYLDATPYLTKYEVEGEGYFIPFADTPLDDKNTSRNMYIHMINNAKKSVTIMTPYLVIDGETATALKFQAACGVDVRIIIPAMPDKKIVYMVSESFVSELVKGGVKVYKFNPGFVHSKVIVVDEEEAMVGTANLDFRSLYLHFENNVWASDHKVTKEINSYVNETLKESTLVTYESIKKQGLLKKIFVAILRAFTPML